MKKTEASDHAHQTGNTVKASDQRLILEYIKNATARHQPCTCDILRIALGKPKSTITARLALLQAWGVVYDSGKTHFGSTLWAYEPDPVLQGQRGRAYRKARHLARVLSILENDLEFCSPYLVHALRRHLDEQETGAAIAAKVLSTPPDKFAGNR